MRQIRQRGDALANGRHIDDVMGISDIHVEMLQIRHHGAAVANGRHIDEATAIIEAHMKMAGRDLIPPRVTRTGTPQRRQLLSGAGSSRAWSFPNFRVPHRQGLR